MAGTVRPYTLQDILGQLNQNTDQTQGSIVPLQGFFNPTNEQTTITDKVTGTVTTNPVWDAGTWGMSVWA